MPKEIPFSPPDISEQEIEAVSEVLRSGWITTGKKTKEFEEKLAVYCEANHAVALNSATAGLELVLKTQGIGRGHEVITSPYTYAATANVLVHRDITPVFVDLGKDSFFMDEQKLFDAINDKTKAIITIDIAGVPVDYDAIRRLLKEKGREDVVLISDSAHSFGSTYKKSKVGSQMDFHVFSFHAIKNLTTAEGGAITFNDNAFHGKKDLGAELKYTALHGQNKDAFTKMQAGTWKYDILTDGFKCNMTDIMAAIGLVQLDRYNEMLEKRKAIHDVYSSLLETKEWAMVPFFADETKQSNCHLYTLRLRDCSEEQRDGIIKSLAQKGIATNVHYMPLPMFTLYKRLGYTMENYPNAYAQYANEISLPVYSKLTVEDAGYIAKELISHIEA